MRSRISSVGKKIGRDRLSGSGFQLKDLCPAQKGPDRGWLTGSHTSDNARQAGPDRSCIPLEEITGDSRIKHQHFVSSC